MQRMLVEQLQALLGTLTALRVLSHLALVRLFIVKSQGDDDILARVGPNVMTVLWHTLEELFLQPVLVDALKPVPLEFCDTTLTLLDSAHDDLRTCALRARCVWACLSIIEKLAHEHVFVSQQLLVHTRGTAALRRALSCLHPCIAAAAAAVVRQVCTSSIGRYACLEQGFVAALVARCSAAEASHVRGFVVQALHKLLGGPEAMVYLRQLRPLLTKDLLQQVSNACLSSTVCFPFSILLPHRLLPCQCACGPT